MPQKNKSVYSSYIKDMPFLFLETRKAAKLVADGADIESIVSLSTEQNIFQLDKERRRLKLAQKVASRLSVLSVGQINVLATASEETAKLITFYAVIKTDLLFFEFMKDVYSEKQNLGQYDIEDKDIISFLRSKEEIAILCEAGLATRNGSALKIQKPISDGFLQDAFPLTDSCALAMGLEVQDENA
jgi:hypothetical protein